MTKKEFIDAVADETNVSKMDTKMMVEAVIKVLVTQMIAGRKVRLAGLGTFTVKRFPGHRQKMPNGKQMDIPAQNRVTFKTAKGLRAKLNNSIHAS